MHKYLCIKFYILFSLSLLPCSLVVADSDPDNFETIRNLQNDWLLYDWERASYVPYILNTPFQANSLSFLLGTEENAGYSLRLCIQKGASLFIEQNIITKFNQAGCYNFSIDSIHQRYAKKKVFITIYHPLLKKELTRTHIINDLSERRSDELKDRDIIQLQARGKGIFNDFFIIGLLLISAFVAALFNLYPKTFHDFYKLDKTFSLKSRDESRLVSSPINGITLVFLFVYSVVFSFLIIVIWHQLGGVPKFLGFVNFSNLSGMGISWAIFSVLIFIAILAKYIVISAVTSLFNIKDFASIHFFDFIRMSQVFMIFILIMVSLLELSFQSYQEIGFKLVIYLAIFFSIIIVLVLFFKLLRSSTFRNIHLFSYLCTTEILPLLIGFKIFLNP